MPLKHMPTLTSFDEETQVRCSAAYVRACSAFIVPTTPPVEAEELRAQIGDTLIGLANLGLASDDGLYDRLLRCLRNDLLEPRD